MCLLSKRFPAYSFRFFLFFYFYWGGALLVLRFILFAFVKHPSSYQNKYFKKTAGQAHWPDRCAGTGLVAPSSHLACPEFLGSSPPNPRPGEESGTFSGVKETSSDARSPAGQSLRNRKLRSSKLALNGGDMPVGGPIVHSRYIFISFIYCLFTIVMLDIH